MAKQQHYDIYSLENCANLSFNNENMNVKSEVKEEALDLTVHCEPTLMEEDDDEEGDSYNERFLDEECLDPLEFLEVDQKSIAECLEDNDLTDSQSKSQMLAVEAGPLNSEDSSQEAVNKSIPPGYILCEKCGCLKKVSNSVMDPPISNSRDLISREKLPCKKCILDKFKCKVCKKHIKQLCVELHMRKHKRTKKHVCLTCGKEFLYPSQLRNHVFTHSDEEEKERTFVCDICDKPFKLLKSLRLHKSSCAHKKLYHCIECGETFPLKQSFFNHQRAHEKVQDDSFNCEICCIVFDNSSSKKEHIMQVHVAAQRFVCDICGEAFVTESAMKRHIVKHSRSYPCKMCEESFTTRRDLLSHQVQHRPQKNLLCKTCGMEFEQMNSYKEHKIYQCCNEDRTVCDHCEKTFKDKTALKKHMMVHLPLSERSVSCEICQRSFCGNSVLKKHIRLIHANSRPYTCEFCSKSFNQLCKLKNHILIHASDKPVSCDICNKAFSNEKDIKIHMRTHTGERPFKCNVCDKSFRQRGHVKTHQLVHTKEKPFSCQLCDKSFGLPSSLKKHMKLHTSNIVVTTR